MSGAIIIFVLAQLAGGTQHIVFLQCQPVIISTMDADGNPFTHPAYYYNLYRDGDFIAQLPAEIDDEGNPLPPNYEDEGASGGDHIYSFTAIDGDMEGPKADITVSVPLNPNPPTLYEVIVK